MILSVTRGTNTHATLHTRRQTILVLANIENTRENKDLSSRQHKCVHHRRINDVSICGAQTLSSCDTDYRASTRPTTHIHLPVRIALESCHADNVASNLGHEFRVLQSFNGGAWIVGVG